MLSAELWNTTLHLPAVVMCVRRPNDSMVHHYSHARHCWDQLQYLLFSLTFSLSTLFFLMRCCTQQPEPFLGPNWVFVIIIA